MTPEQRFDRAERILVMMAKAGRRARHEWREQSREQSEKINVLISTQIRNEEEWRAESHATNEKINLLIDAQIKTSEQIDRTEKTLRAFIDSLRGGQNGKSSN